MNKENNNEVFQCICGKQFDNKPSFGAHKTHCQVYQAQKKQERKLKQLPNGMFKCEECGKEHDGSYGSGRFCSKHCSRAFTASKNKNYATKEELIARGFFQNQVPYGTWKCIHCGEIFETRAKLKEHIKIVHYKTISTDLICPFCGKKLQNKYAKGGHIRNCKFNPNRETYKKIAKETGKKLSKMYEAGEILPSFKGKHHTEMSKKKVSLSMKKAHEEGRANNFAHSRHSCGKMSYPEQWLLAVIKNRFNDQNFMREYTFYKYSLDFAWPDKKKCIEIDGSQHYDPRFPERLNHDIKRDIFVKSQGWQVLRLRWTYVLKQKEYWIRVAKKFIDENNMI